MLMFPIIYEDAAILVIDKPAGVAVHADAHHTGGTILDEVRITYPHAELAHRLDKDTSGLLIVAKNADAHVYLKQLFKTRAIAKTYLALVSGIVIKDDMVIALAIGRSSQDFRKRVAKPTPDENARPAETHIRVLKRLGAYTLIEAMPKTGRTHQVRTHLSSIGHPIACDTLYGGKKFLCPTGLTRQFLHAFALEFTTHDGKRLRLEAALPSDLANVLHTLESTTRA